MGKFRLRKAVAAADLDTLRVQIIGGLPAGLLPEPLTTQFALPSGKHVQIFGGLPDVLAGESGAARQIWTGSADHGSTNYQPWMDDLPLSNDAEPAPVEYVGGEYRTNPAWHAWMLAHNAEYAAEAAAEQQKAAYAAAKGE